MSKLLRDAVKAAEVLDEASQERIARIIMRELEQIEGRTRLVDRRAQIERIRRLSPLHGRGEEFRQIAREFREGIRFKHDDDEQ
jgi:hypothetical protein